MTALGFIVAAILLGGGAVGKATFVPRASDPHNRTREQLSIAATYMGTLLLGFMLGTPT